MSNNRAEPSLSKLPFLAVEYEDRKAAIGRNSNYQETLASIKKMFGAIRNAPDEDICINAHLEEMDDVFRIADEIWPEILPRLTLIKVSLDPPSHSKKPAEQAATGAKINLLRRPWGNLNGQVLEVFVTQIALTSTVGQLIGQIQREKNTTDTIYIYYNGSGIYSNTNVTLSDCGLTNPTSILDIIFGQ